MIGLLVGTQRILDILNGVIGVIERVDMLTNPISQSGDV